MRTLFIINPKSGRKLGGGKLKSCIEKHFPQAEIVFTEYKGHARELASAAAKQGVEKVIAAGGDGTINEVVQGLAGSESALGVIALGSGNGLARELGCPLAPLEKMVKAIKTFTVKPFDLGLVNGEYFINLTGVGIEADIASAFDAIGAGGKRGMWPYFKLGAKIFFKYKAPSVEVETDEGKYAFKVLSLVFANGRQYGSNFTIAPKAFFDDGFLDMAVLKKANIFKLLLGLPSFFFPSFKVVSLVETHKIKRAKVKLGGAFSYHIDGEPKQARDILEIEIRPAAIKVLSAADR